MTQFIIILTLFTTVLIWWGAKNLTKEKWQFFVIVPWKKHDNGNWDGLNLTYYGVFNAIAYTLAVSILIILMISAGVKLMSSIILAIALLAICMPASRIVAWVVEGNPHRFTVGGAAFTGIICLPWVMELLNTFILTESPIPVIPASAACACAYAYGEGVGRLACLSFGCCYGTPLNQLNPKLQGILKPIATTFSGVHKKACYTDNLEHVPLVPVQLLTSIFFTTSAIISIILFCNGWFKTAFILTIIATQGWRFTSEFLRSDDRGEGKLSAYQIMALTAIVYSLFISWNFNTNFPTVDIINGLSQFWTPGMLLGMQALALLVLLYTGSSTVTGSTVKFRVNKDRV